MELVKQQFMINAIKGFSNIERELNYIFRWFTIKYFLKIVRYT